MANYVLHTAGDCEILLDMDILTPKLTKEQKREYYQALAEDYGIDVGIVKAIAASLPDSELFDGLVSMVQDYAGY